jgi:hypothetical protein
MRYLRVIIIRRPIVIIVLLSTIIMSCHKLCVPGHFSFNGGVASVLPDQDSIHIGDTLWFASSLPVNYKYLGGSDSSVYNLSGATNVGTDIHLVTLLGASQYAGAIDSFLFVPQKGNIAPNPLAPHAAKTISFFEEGSNYVFSVGIIAQKKSIYCLAIIDIPQAMKNCDRISVTIMMNKAEGHLHYLKDIYYGGAAIGPIDSTHSYCVKVY